MAYDFSTVRVLIVEDNQFVRQLIKMILKGLGFTHILSADTVSAAYKLYQAELPDIIITDWVLKDGTGLQLTKRIRQASGSPAPYTPIICVSGFAEERRVKEARDAGITEFMIKPFTAQDLYKRIYQTIEHPRAFVKCKTYFGPDRRRKRKLVYNGPYRRHDDERVKPRRKRSA